MKFVALFLVLSAAMVSPAQSRRVVPQNIVKPGTETPELSVKQMFDEANAYNRTKFATYEKDKVPYSEALRLQTEREKKQLAAKYAGIAASRTGLTGEDYYYLGFLHWIAENFDGTVENLLKFTSQEAAVPERAQTARSIIAVVLAKQKKLADAEKILADYLAKQPQKLTERTRIEGELAKAYQAEKNFAKMAPHAEEAYRSAKTLAEDPTSRTRGLDELLDSGMLAFEAYRDQNKLAEADTALIDMQSFAAKVGSPTFFYYATDKLITYMLETNRKPLALETYMSSLIKAGKDLPLQGQRTDAIERLKRREKHYKILQEPASELISVEAWFPGERQNLQALRGKVVLLDFWATWCAPCFEAFPALSEWHQDLGPEGLVVLGVTRFYGQAEGFRVDNPNEIDFLKRFKAKHKLGYDFVVVGDQQSQMAYDAMALPTTVLIDRKGKIRYIEAGTSMSRIEDLRRMILKLLAEK
jgi:thiol-disulfide isomerase/thioredoxin